MTINSGLSLQTVGTKTAADVTSGIRSPRVRKLTPGTKLYRFGNADFPPSSWPCGAWWFGRTAFNRIVQDAIANPDFGLGWAGRKKLAVRQCWNKVNGLVEATIKEEIYIFAGRGTHQYHEMMPNGMKITWLAPANIEQWYLPNISLPRGAGLTAEGRQALSVYRTAKVESYQLY